MRDDIWIDRKGQRVLSMDKLIGKGYTKAWFSNCRVRYRLFCGARSTKKSKVIIGYEPLFKILSDPRRNIVILRQNDSDNRQSTFENICGCIIDLGMENVFKISKNPLTIEYLPTGQQILFRGLNNPTGLNGITFAHGYWTDAYLEEAFEVSSFEDFRKLDGSIRGRLPDDLFFQITMCFNAWDGETWLYEEFFKNRLEDDYSKLDDDNTTYMDYYDPDFIGPYGRGLYLHKSTYKINEFRNARDYDAAAKEMKRKAPEIYKVEFLGMFGNTGMACYPEWNDNLFIPQNQIIGKIATTGQPIMKFAEYAIGIDTGLSNGEGRKIPIAKNEDPNVKIRAATTMTLCGITSDLNKMVVIDEYFHTNIKGNMIWNTDDQEQLGLPEQADRLLRQIVKWCEIYGNSGTILMKGTINVYVDSADVGFRQVMEMKAHEYGLFNLRFMGSTKISIQSRVDFWRLMMAYGDMILSDKCKNLRREIRAARKGKKGEAREDGNDHVITAAEYNLQPMLNSLRRWKTFKQH